MNDSLGDRMKQDYENRTRYTLPRRTYTIARVDGKAFHTFTKDCDKPFDHRLTVSMNYAAKAVCENTQGCQFAYVQSDEASFLLTDFDNINTAAYFDGNLQKICSILASMFTAKFNFSYSNVYNHDISSAMFDCRVFSIPDPIEVENYFYWRWSDWRRNFAQAVGHVHFSHNELEGLNRQGIQDKLYLEKKIDLSTFPDDQKFGRICKRKNVEIYINGVVARHDPIGAWEVVPAINYRENRAALSVLVPKPGY